MSAATNSPRHTFRPGSLSEGMRPSPWQQLLASPLGAFRDKLSLRQESDSFHQKASPRKGGAMHSITFVSGERFEEQLSWGPENLKMMRKPLVRCKNCSHMSYPEAVAEHDRYCPLKPVMCAYTDPKTGMPCGFISRGKEMLTQHEAQCPFKDGDSEIGVSPRLEAKSCHISDTSDSYYLKGDDTQDTKQPTCEYCGVSFNCAMELKNHVALCSEKSVACPLLCGKFIRRADVTFHITKEVLLHRPMPVPSPEDRPPEDPAVVLALVVNLLLKKNYGDTRGVDRSIPHTSPARRPTPSLKNRTANEPTPRCATPLSRNRAADGPTPRSASPSLKNRAANGPTSRGASPSLKNRTANEPTPRCATPLSRNRAANGPTPRSASPSLKNRAANGPISRGASPSLKNRAANGLTPRSASPSLKNRAANGLTPRGASPSLKNRAANGPISRGASPSLKNRAANGPISRGASPSLKNRAANGLTPRSASPSLKNRAANGLTSRAPILSSRNKPTNESETRCLTLPSSSRAANESTTHCFTLPSRNRSASVSTSRCPSPLSRKRSVSESTTRRLTPSSRNRSTSETRGRRPTTPELMIARPRLGSSRSGRGCPLTHFSRPMSKRDDSQQLQSSADDPAASDPHSAVLPTMAIDFQFHKDDRLNTSGAEASSVIGERAHKPPCSTSRLPLQTVESLKPRDKPNDKVVQDLLNTLKQQRSAVNQLKDEFFTVDAKNMSEYENQKVRGELKERMESVDVINEQIYHRVTFFVDVPGPLSDQVVEVIDGWRSLDRYWYEVKCALHDHLMRV